MIRLLAMPTQCNRLPSPVRHLQARGAAMITILATLILGLLALDARLAVGQSAERHAGTVVSVDAGGRSVVLQELVEEGRPRRLTVRVPDGTPIVLSQRIPDEGVWITRFEDVFQDRSVALGDVRAGDFVVIEGQARGGTATARQLVITFRGDKAPSPAGAGSTSRP
jgi:hypothetical protein